MKTPNGAALKRIGWRAEVRGTIILVVGIKEAKEVTRMTYRGHVHGGVVVLDDPDALPEGSEVTVNPLSDATEDDIHPDVKKLIGIIPPDVDVDQLRFEAIMEKHG